MANDKLATNVAYNRKRYVWRQVSDVVNGSVTIKQAGEVYLPMPSGMRSVPSDVSTARPKEFGVNNADYNYEFLPWYHDNPAYRAYLQRARFPDLTANTLRGLVGVATRINPEVKLPANLNYLLEVATPCGKSLFELYSHCVNSILSTGKMTLVLDVTDQNVVTIVPYEALANVNWKYGLVEGRKRQTIATFVEDKTEEDDEEVHLHYFLKMPEEEKGLPVAMVQKFVDGTPFGDASELVYLGKRINVLPVVNIGSVSNTADPDIVPMLGMSDIALQIYREDADSSQARYLTCNPTLFITGIDQTDAPKVIGSTVVIGISNPAARAYYTNTDTSALEHMRTNRKDLFEEAISYGATFLGAQNSTPESGEALKVRQSSNGATLVHIVTQVGKGIADILKLAAEWTGGTVDSVEFEPSIEFAEVTLSAQDITALVAAWVQGGISQDTLLDNLRYAGIIDPDKTNEEEKTDIENSRPVIAMPPGGGNNNDPFAG